MIFGSSSVQCHRQSSATFEKFSKMCGNIRLAFGKIFAKSSEKSSKTFSSVCLYNKQNNAWARGGSRIFLRRGCTTKEWSY